MKMKLHILFGLILLSSCVKIEKRSYSIHGRDAKEYIAEGANIKEEGVVLQNFNTNIKGWFGCNDLAMENESGALKLDFADARFQCIGNYLEYNDLTEIPVVHIRLRVYSENSEPLTAVIRFEDNNEISTNYDEETIRINVNQEYVDYYVDFTGKLVSVNGDFDAENVKKMKMYFNTKGSQNFTGTVWIDEIGLKPAIPKE